MLLNLLFRCYRHLWNTDAKLNLETLGKLLIENQLSMILHPFFSFLFIKSCQNSAKFISDVAHKLANLYIVQQTKEDIDQ